MFDFKNINKIYPNGFHAVRDFDLEIADGEFVVFVGPSGCGKSTSLRMLAGLEEVTGGDILIGDRRVNDVAPGDRDIAMVFQNYALYPHMTVRKNLAFGLKMPRHAERRNRAPHERGLQKSWVSARCWTAARASFPAASGNGSLWAGRLSATRRSSCSTNRSRTSTPNCACRCARKSPPCTSGSARR